jgi:hypothetical protein
VYFFDRYNNMKAKKAKSESQVIQDSSEAFSFVALKNNDGKYIAGGKVLQVGGVWNGRKLDGGAGSKCLYVVEIVIMLDDVENPFEDAESLIVVWDAESILELDGL